jgi:hypothetical protein
MQEKLDRLTQRAAEKSDQQGVGLRGKVAELRKKIEELADERGTIQTLPRTKGDVLELIRTSFPQAKKDIFVADLLGTYLKTLQVAGSDPFWPIGLKSFFLSDLHRWKLLVGLFQLEDFKLALETIPEVEGALSLKQKEAKVVEIDGKISDLEKQILKLIG